MQSQQQLSQFRAQIDALDERIVELLAARTKIVQELMVLKKDEESVRGCDRVHQVLDRIGRLASIRGIPADIAVRTYRALIEALTDMQLQYLAASQGTGTPTQQKTVE